MRYGTPTTRRSTSGSSVTMANQGSPGSLLFSTTIVERLLAISCRFQRPRRLRRRWHSARRSGEKHTRRWHVCGIPQVLYIDHGSDLASRPIEQVAADSKIQLIFSGTDRPCGGGKCERFFSTMTEVLLSRLPGNPPVAAKTRDKAMLTLPELDQEFERYLIGEYLATPHRETGQTPQARWDAGGFLPQMAESLEKLDLLLLTIPKACRIHQGGVRFLGLRDSDPTLTAYAGEEVMLHYDPRDMAEVRVFHQDRFLCRAICQELASETVTLGEIIMPAITGGGSRSESAASWLIRWWRLNALLAPRESPSLPCRRP